MNTRMVMLLSGILLIIGSYKLMRSLHANEDRARWFTFFVSFSPYFFYYSITVSPNLPALTWFVWGLALIIPRIEASKWDWRFWAGIIIITIGTLSKATYLFFGIPIAYLFLNRLREEPRVKSFIITGLSFFVVIIPNLVSYLHSKRLFENAPYERQRYAELWPDFFPESWLDVTSTIRPAVIEWFLQLYVNTIAIPFFLVGLFAAITYKKWKTKSGKFWMAWLISFLIFGILFFTQFRQHAYYMTPLLMIAAMGSSYGIEILWRFKKMRFALCLILFLIPVVMVGRVGHRWLWAKQVPDELVYKADQLQDSIPKNELVMVFGDSSPVIYLYYLHRKGVSLSPAISGETIKKYINQGFRFIVSDMDIHKIPALTEYKLKKINTVGSFSVYTI
jgi:4-amino-4-deoxy-L-arabinose transferase-like glycosyltransferase